MLVVDVGGHGATLCRRTWAARCARLVRRDHLRLHTHSANSLTLNSVAPRPPPPMPLSEKRGEVEREVPVRFGACPSGRRVRLRGWRRHRRSRERLPKRGDRAHRNKQPRTGSVIESEGEGPIASLPRGTRPPDLRQHLQAPAAVARPPAMLMNNTVGRPSSPSPKFLVENGEIPFAQAPATPEGFVVPTARKPDEGRRAVRRPSAPFVSPSLS